jgi:hypothetical protein
VEAPLLEVCAAASAHHVLTLTIQVEVNLPVPRLHDLVQLLKHQHIVLVILLHLSPRQTVTGKALAPQFKADELLVLQLLVLGAELVRHVLQLVAGEPELLRGDKLGVDVLEVTGGREALQDKPCVKLLDIKVDAVLGDDDVSFIEQVPDTLEDLGVVLNVLGLTLVHVHDLVSRVAQPLGRPAKHVPVRVNLIEAYVLFPQ